MVTEVLSPAIRLAFCCHLLGNKRLLVFMKVRHLLCHLEFVPKVFGKPNFVIGTQKSHSSPKVWVWCGIMTEMTLVIDRGKLIEKNSLISGRVVILSDSVFASSFSSFKQGWGAEQCDAQKMNEGFCSFFWLPGTLKPGDPAAPVAAPQHMALTFSLCVVTPRISSQCTNSLAIGAQRTWSRAVNAKQRAFKEEQGRKPKADSCSGEQYRVDIIPCHGIEEGMGAWFRAF